MNRGSVVGKNICVFSAQSALTLSLRSQRCARQIRIKYTYILEATVASAAGGKGRTVLRELN